MDCREFEKSISGYLDGELSSELKISFEEHIASCEKCSMQLKEIQSVELMISDFPKPLPDEDYWSGFDARLRGKIENLSEKKPWWNFLPVYKKAFGIITIVVLLLFGAMTPSIREMIFAPPKEQVSQVKNPMPSQNQTQIQYSPAEPTDKPGIGANYPHYNSREGLKPDGSSSKDEEYLKNTAKNKNNTNYPHYNSREGLKLCPADTAEDNSIASNAIQPQESKIPEIKGKYPTATKREIPAPAKESNISAPPAPSAPFAPAASGGVTRSDYYSKPKGRSSEPDATPAAKEGAAVKSIVTFEKRYGTSSVPARTEPAQPAADKKTGQSFYGQIKIEPIPKTAAQPGQPAAPPAPVAAKPATSALGGFAESAPTVKERKTQTKAASEENELYKNYGSVEREKASGLKIKATALSAKDNYQQAKVQSNQATQAQQNISGSYVSHSKALLVKIVNLNGDSGELESLRNTIKNSGYTEELKQAAKFNKNPRVRRHAAMMKSVVDAVMTIEPAKIGDLKKRIIDSGMIESTDELETGK